MQYQYRWIYGLMTFLFLIVTGYFYYIQPQWQEMHRLRNERQELLQRLNSEKNWIERMQGYPKTSLAQSLLGQVDLIGTFLDEVHKENLLINSLQILPITKWHDVDVCVLHIEVIGDYQQITSFISIWQQQLPQVVLADFSYHSQKENKYLFSAEIILAKKKLTALTGGKVGLFQSMSNPFCSSHAGELMSTIDLSTAASFSLTQMRMIGYMQLGERKEALILLPNNVIVAVKEGMVVGREAGTVEEIKANHLLFVLPNRQRSELTMALV